MKNIFTLVLCLATACISHAGSPFADACSEAATSVLCGNYTDCKIVNIMSSSKNGNNSKRGGAEECKDLALFAKNKGVSAETKRAISRMKKQLETLNNEIKKDIPNIKVTADFARLEMEEIVELAQYMDSYGRDKRPSHCATSYASSDSSKEFNYRYLDSIKTALYNLADDEIGKDQLKKLNEIKIGFYSYGKTDPEVSSKFKMVGKTLVVPGNSKCDTGSFPSSAYEKFINELN